MTTPLPPVRPCSHQYTHLETVRYTKFGGHSDTFVRIDRFFCTKCLHMEEKRREGSSRETPEWYRGGDGTEPA